MQHMQESTLSSSAPHQKTFMQYTNILKLKRDWTFKFCIITCNPLNVDTKDFQYWIISLRFTNPKMQMTMVRPYQLTTRNTKTSFFTSTSTLRKLSQLFFTSGFNVQIRTTATVYSEINLWQHNYDRNINGVCANFGRFITRQVGL